MYLGEISMNKKRILLVDDEAKVALVLARGLKKLGQEYIVDTANSGAEALIKLHQNPYTLLITDYMMPNMTGFELTQAARKESPDLKTVIMTAYGSKELRTRLETQVDGYIEKPFTLVQLRNIIENLVNAAQKRQRPVDSTERAGLDEVVHRALKKLHQNANAWCVLLLNSSGYPVEVVGHIEGVDIYSMGALVAATCSVFKSNYHEGADYNVYSYNINNKLSLAVFFDRQSKPGLIWFYTKQTAELLAPLADRYLHSDDAQAAAVSEELTSEFADELTDALDIAFFEPPEPEPVPTAESDPDPDPTSPSTKRNGQKQRPMSFAEAVKAGLVPAHILAKEEKSEGE